MSRRIRSSTQTSLVSSMLLPHKLKQTYKFKTNNQPLFSKQQTANLHSHCYVTSGWHNIALWFAQMFCFRVFVRFARCNFYFYIVFVSQIVIILVFVFTERSAIILVFIFVFVTKIALIHTFSSVNLLSSSEEAETGLDTR